MTSTIKANPNWTKVLDTKGANGTYTLTESLSNFSEISVHIIIGSTTRGTVIVSKEFFKTYGVMPDVYIAARGYANIKGTSDTQVTFTNVTLPTAWGTPPSAGFAIYAK